MGSLQRVCCKAFTVCGSPHSQFSPAARNGSQRYAQSIVCQLSEVAVGSKFLDLLSSRK